MTTILAIALPGAFVAGFLLAAILASGKADDAYRRGLRDGNPFTPLVDSMGRLSAYLRRVNDRMADETATWRDGTDD